MVHSFPTRRSSDLRQPALAAYAPQIRWFQIRYWIPSRRRSEEHTSELQSHHPISYAVCCLKKKNIEGSMLGSPDGGRAQVARGELQIGELRVDLAQRVLTCFFLLLRRPPRSTLDGTHFPYPTLFR